MLAVIYGKGKSVSLIADNIKIVRGILADEKCAQIGTVINRACNRDVDAIRNIFKDIGNPEEINFVLPEKDILQKLTIRQIAKALDAEHIYGKDESLNMDEFRVISKKTGKDITDDF